MSTFYVYALFDAHGVVRYIGKGKGNRISQHLSDKRSRKTFVDDALRDLGDIPRLKLRCNLSEHEAYATEHAFIQAIGCWPDGPLVNKTAKGSGPNSLQVKTGTLDEHLRFVLRQRNEVEEHLLPRPPKKNGRLLLDPMLLR